MAGETLRAICSDENMPDRTTVFRWLQTFEDFHIQYARAREVQADTLVDESLDIADDGRNDWMENNDPENPGYRVNGEHIQRSRLRIDQRRWMAGKMRPKVYGDRVETVHTDPQGNNPFASLLDMINGAGRPKPGGADE